MSLFPHIDSLPLIPPPPPLSLPQLLPFLEYRVHCCLINKLRLLGMNVVCRLRVKISLGETVVTAIAVRWGEGKVEECKVVVVLRGVV